MNANITNKLDEAICLLRCKANGANIHRVSNLLQYLDRFKVEQSYTDSLRAYSEFIKQLVDAYDDGRITDEEKKVLLLANEQAYESVKRFLNA